MMATKIESELPPSPQSYESDGEEGVDPHNQEEEEDDEQIRQPVNNNVANILARLQSSGALIKKPKQEFYCFTCKLDFPDWEELESHLIQHVSLPSVVIDKLPSDDESETPSGDENWFNEEDEATPPQILQQKTPQKVDISQILKNKGLSIKKNETPANSTSALNKLSSLGLTIKNNSTSIKKEKPDSNSSDVMQRLGKLGGIKLKLKSDGNNTNTFKVVNGLKDFKASDDDDDSENEQNEEQEDEIYQNKSEDNDESRGDDSTDDQTSSRKPSESDDSDAGKNLKLPKGIQITPKKNLQEETKVTPVKLQERPRGRPAVKQTPTRANLQATKEALNANIEKEKVFALPERTDSNASAETIVIKKEESDFGESQSSTPIFSEKIKIERLSPPLPDSSSAPLITKIKTETDISKSSAPIAPLLPGTKTEDAIAVIEINGDSNDEDDDCCVVSTTPAPDIKPKIENVPIVPKLEEVIYPTSTSHSTSSAFSMPQTNYSSTHGLSNRAAPVNSTEKQHNFNWNAPDSKPPIDMLEKSADEIFESLLSSGTKKENMMSDASEYISLDKLGTHHTCNVCNTRFTDISLLDDHRRMTGHSQSLVTAASTLLPYNPSSSILSSLLPVKQIADQVGKLSTIGNNGSGFSHQQNVMINIQTYPGAGGVMMPGQTPYNSYQGAPNMQSNYPPTNNMYGATGQCMPGQFQNSNYMGSNMPYGQYPPQMSKPGYPGTTPQSSFSTQPPYSVGSPLQAMQQSVYGQSGMMNQQGNMGPPGSSPSHQPYAPASSPSGLMKPPSSSGIKIQNVQTFPPGQVVGPGMPSAGQDMGQMSAPGQTVGGQMPAPNMRVTAGPSHMPRPRMPNIRSAYRPTIRAGVQVHGKVRGAKMPQRMPLKRAGGPTGGPGMKRRPDILLPGKHDNEDCQVMALQKQRDGLPLIQSVQGAKDKLGSQISITKKTVNKEANAMANVLASRGISIKQKQKSRSPTPERPIPHIPNLGSGVSIKHTSKSSNFSIPEAKVGGGMSTCKICKKMFGNYNSLQVHMANAHPQSKIPVFKCDECPASYPTSLQLQHHRREFHKMSGPNKELGLPVVDLSQIDNLKRLSSLGIYNFIPLANREQSNGCFGIPVISVHNMQSGITSSLQALCADGLLSLGPLKPLPNT